MKHFFKNAWELIRLILMFVLGIFGFILFIAEHEGGLIPNLALKVAAVATFIVVYFIYKSLNH